MPNKPGRHYERQAAGAPLVARNVNQGLPLLEALDRMGFGRGAKVQWLPGGTPVIWAVAEVKPIRSARTPSGGIPAKAGNTPGSATCTFYVWNGTTHTLGTETALVRNNKPAPFDGNRVIEVYWDMGSWWVLVQSCT